MKKNSHTKKQIGIYLSGLGNAFTHETAEKYADRFKNEYDFHNPEFSAEYQLHTNHFEFDEQKHLITNRVCIEEIFNGESKTIYQFYEFEYASILTRSFKSNNALVRIVTLFVKVTVKIVPMFIRLFYPNTRVGYSPKFRGQTLYLFFMMFVVTLAITFLVPAATVALIDLTIHFAWLKKVLPLSPVSVHRLKIFARLISNVTALCVFFIPGISEEVVSVACEFVSASDYLELGLTKQTIHGQLDMLIEHIIAQEGPECEICIHSYSFGSLIALDYLFPYGNEPSVRVREYVKGLVTIGCPYDFIAVYFPRFFADRNLLIGQQIKWINIYSLADALGSNFRMKQVAGIAEYSFQKEGPLPVNVNYDFANLRMNIIAQFFTLAALRAHSNYWDSKGNGQSCLRLLINAMQKKGMF